MKVIFWGDSLTLGRPGAAFVGDLRQKLPGHELLNRGRNGDTVITLCRRLEGPAAVESHDIAVLWVGVNDVLAARREPWPALPKKLIFGQWARTAEEFLAYYEKAVCALRAKARRVLLVSPLCIGEDPANPLNRRLEELAAALPGLADPARNILYLDLRKPFFARLPARPSAYMPGSAALLLDAVFHTPEKAELKALRRGLRLTTDGVHPNLRGARLLAELFFAALSPYLSRNR